MDRQTTGMQPATEPWPLSGRRLVAPFVPYRTGRSLVFETPTKRIVVRKHTRKVATILGMCSGVIAHELISSFPVRRRAPVRTLIDSLHECGLIVTTEELPLLLSQLTSNSTRYMRRELGSEELDEIYALPRYQHSLAAEAHVLRPLRRSQTMNLLVNRSSVDPAHLAPQECTPVELDTLVDLARAGYGNVDSLRKTVPSAGNLHPLSLFLLWPGEEKHLQLAWYDDLRDSVNEFGSRSLLSVRKWFVPEGLVQSLLSLECGVVIICADLSRSSAKYGGRAFRYVLMEAGAACQNMYLFASERQIGIRAIGGFLDQSVAESLSLPSQVVPLLAILVTNAVD